MVYVGGHMRTRTLFVVLISILLSTVIPCEATEADLRASLRKALAIPANALEDSRVVLSLVQSVPDMPNANVTVLFELTRKGKKTKDHILYSGQEVPPEPTWTNAVPDVIAAETRQVRISDGTHVLMYNSTKGTSDTETQIGRGLRKVVDENVTRNGRFQMELMLGMVNGVSPAGILQNEASVVHRELTTIDGVATHLVECPMMRITGMDLAVKYWLAPDRSGLPVRMELIDREGNIFKSLHTLDFTQVGGIWFIKRITEQADSAAGAALRRTTTYELKKIELNPSLDESAFFSTSPDRLPAGAAFQDMISGLAYTISGEPGNDGKPQTQAAKQFRPDGIQKTPRPLDGTGTLAQTTDTGSSPRRRWPMYLLPLAVMGVVVGWSLARSGRKNRRRDGH